MLPKPQITKITGMAKRYTLDPEHGHLISAKDSDWNSVLPHGQQCHQRHLSVKRYTDGLKPCLGICTHASANDSLHGTSQGMPEASEY